MKEVLKSHKDASAEDVKSIITEHFIASLDAEKVNQLVETRAMEEGFLYEGTIFAWSNPSQIRAIMDYVEQTYLDSLKQVENDNEQKNHLLNLVKEDKIVGEEVKTQVVNGMKLVWLDSSKNSFSLKSLINSLEKLFVTRERQLFETGKYSQFKNFIDKKIEKEKNSDCLQ